MSGSLLGDQILSLLCATGLSFCLQQQSEKPDHIRASLFRIHSIQFAKALENHSKEHEVKIPA